VQQSNYLWDIEKKQQIVIEGMEASYDANGSNAAFTTDGKYLFCLEKMLVTIVNVNQKKVTYATGRYATNMAVSANKDYYTFFRPDNTRVYKMTVNPNSVETELEISPKISVSPMPGKDIIRIEIESPHSYSESRISAVSSLGAAVGEIYHGDIGIGKQLFFFSTSGLSSGQYSIFLRYGGHTTSVPFIITK
jgi:hypothetical protein